MLREAFPLCFSVFCGDNALRTSPRPIVPKSHCLLFLCASASLREDYVFQCLFGKSLPLCSSVFSVVRQSFWFTFAFFAFFVAKLLLFSAVNLWFRRVSA